MNGAAVEPAVSPAGIRGMTATALVIAGSMMLLAGCAGFQQSSRAELSTAPNDVQECAAWLTSVDTAISEAGVNDAEAYRVPGFPYLRVNRFLSSFRQKAGSDPVAFAAWQDRMRELEARTRGYELENMPTAALSSIGAGNRQDAMARVEHCAAVLAKYDAGSGSRRRALVDRAQVPDDYADWKRIAGLYPLVKLPFFEFAKGWQTESTDMFRQANTSPADQEHSRRFSPAASGMSGPAVTATLGRAKADALGIPQFTSRETESLLATFAPVYEIATTGDYDGFGFLHWGPSPAPEVDTRQPTVYGRVAFTRYGERTLVQLVYLIWFPERPANGWLDLLSGRLDGLIFRVTLSPTGEPLVYDSIHACGCYHMFFPTPSVKPIPPPETRVEWAFIPRSLPAIQAPQRVVLRLTSRSHYLIDVHPEAAGTEAGSPYTIADDGVLRTLPIAGGARSMFGPSGIVAGTQRGERIFTWPLGIDDAGAMREWGRHATALVGRRHFDDADLIARRFEMLAAPGAVPSPRPGDD
jgi:hypothetical protein